MLFDTENEGELYTNYVETTVDTGNTLVVLAIIVCICTFLALPCAVALGRRYQRRQHERREGEDEREVLERTYDDDDEDRPVVASEENRGHNDTRTEQIQQPTRRPKASGLCLLPSLHEDAETSLHVLDAGIRRRRRGIGGENIGRRRVLVTRGMAEEGRVSVVRRKQVAGNAVATSFCPPNPNVSIAVGEHEVEVETGYMPSFSSPPLSRSLPQDLQVKHTISEESNHSVNLAGDVDTPISSPFGCCSSYRPSNAIKAFDFVVSLAEYDNETYRILRLAIPFTVSACVEALTEIVDAGHCVLLHWY